MGASRVEDWSEPKCTQSRNWTSSTKAYDPSSARERRRRSACVPLPIADSLGTCARSTRWSPCPTETYTLCQTRTCASIEAETPPDASAGSSRASRGEPRFANRVRCSIATPVSPSHGDESEANRLGQFLFRPGHCSADHGSDSGLPNEEKHVCHLHRFCYNGKVLPFTISSIILRRRASVARTGVSAWSRRELLFCCPRPAMAKRAPANRTPWSAFCWSVRRGKTMSRC
jgi:hypothetical protein